MKLLNIVIIVLAVLFLVLLGVVGFLLLSSPESNILESSPAIFSVLETGTAADRGYSVFNYRGEGQVTVLALGSKPKTDIHIMTDENAIETTGFETFVDDLRSLEVYGYNITVDDSPIIGEGIYVIPTGAIPSYVLFNLQEGTSQGTIFYIGKKDLVISSGIKKQDWYNSLTDDQKHRIICYDGTLDEFLANGNSLFDDILYEKWNQQSNSTIYLDDSGLKTVSIQLADTHYIRLIYDVDNSFGMYDSDELKPVGDMMFPVPQNKFPWEKSNLLVSLNKTNGTAYYSVKKDGKIVEQEVLSRVSDSNVFPKKLIYSEPGYYIIEVYDNSGVISSGLLHVKDLKVNLIGQNDLSYVFNITVDGEPLKSTEAFVYIGNSTSKKKFYINDGILTINAKLDKGENIFNIEIFDSVIPTPVYKQSGNLLEFYLSYGLPGIGLILLVYFGARMTKKPLYTLRFGDVGSYVRPEICIPTEAAMGGFKKIRAEMNIGNNPITSEEFAISIKRYHTNGADVTEGNVEELLSSLVKRGYLETHRDHYQLKGEGDIKTNTLKRMVREKLIETGTMFDEKGNKFITNGFEIGFFGEKFSKKGIIIVDGESEKQRFIDSLNDINRARLNVMRANSTIDIIPIDRLDDLL
ncbi:hypothetical protein KKF81_00745 [Candidatus Micrarchaeota archaeon]|nr:hypothetical protein [Candidatus Micrarchaeota archaeon]MBU1165447.1 hypothetical protein [Candidatus Micrarchaeota archaeon]MBU1887428.1 hypothetical protein [Candidatus Micrarchaeota archaeon]